MSGEMITIITVGVALAGLILTSFRALRDEITGLRAEVTDLRIAMASLRERMAHLVGFIEGLKEAITSRGESRRVTAIVKHEGEGEGWLSEAVP